MSNNKKNTHQNFPLHFGHQTTPVNRLIDNRPLVPEPKSKLNDLLKYRIWNLLSLYMSAGFWTQLSKVNYNAEYFHPLVQQVPVPLLFAVMAE